MSIKKLLPFVLFPCLIFSCNNHPADKVTEEKASPDSNSTAIYPSEPETSSAKNSVADTLNTSIKTFRENSQWGYDILVDGKLYIHQPQIPSVPGTNGFKSEDDAKKTAEFVAYKIRHHIMPPSVTPEELDSLGIVKKDSK